MFIFRVLADISFQIYIYIYVYLKVLMSQYIAVLRVHERGYPVGTLLFVFPVRRRTLGNYRRMLYADWHLPSPRRRLKYSTDQH